MTVKKNYLVGIMDDTKINEVNDIIATYATMTSQYTSFMFFSKQPIDTQNITNDITLFQLESENEITLNKTLNELINELNELNADYVLGDDDTKELIVTIDHVSKLFIKFDNIKTIKEGTFKKINELKKSRTEYGYCKGFNPEFRPLEGPVGDKKINNEIMYLISDSSENLSKLTDYISQKVIEIDQDFIIESMVFQVDKGVKFKS